MTVFKTFLKLVNAYKVPIIMYTVFLVFFAGFNMRTNESSINFEATKPDILIINNDEDKGITNCLVEYLEKNNNVVDIKGETNIADALFYRDVNYNNR